MEQQGKQPLSIRQAREEDLEQMMEIYSHARQFMADHGNPGQWAGGYPPEELILEGIESGNQYVCEAGGRIAGVFYYREGTDPTYLVIREGSWLNDDPYGVVHRIAADGTVRGVGSFCLQWAWNRCRNIRIDTHQDNVVMQNLLKKNGFQYCGLIRTERGGERLAYQKPDEAEKHKSMETGMEDAAL